jgi:acetolactate synthase regulatory subunit
VIAKGNRQEVDRDFHFIVAAASYHLAHLSARAYSLLAIVEADENFAPLERVLALLRRRNFRALHTSVASGEGSDARIAADIQTNLDQAEATAELADGGNEFAHLSARAYSLLAIVEADENFVPLERVLALLMRRNFRALHTSVLNYRASGEGTAARTRARSEDRELFLSGLRLAIGETT